MNGAPFRHIGGAVIADHGALSLAAARRVAAFYRREAEHPGAAATPALARLCLERARNLDAAATAAIEWRRAAGWSDPDQAHRPLARPV